MEEKSSVPIPQIKKHMICNLQDYKANIIFERKTVEISLGLRNRHYLEFQYLTQ